MGWATPLGMSYSHETAVFKAKVYAGKQPRDMA